MSHVRQQSHQAEAKALCSGEGTSAFPSCAFFYPIHFRKTFKKSKKVRNHRIFVLEVRLNEKNAQRYHRISSPFIQLEDAMEIYWAHTEQLLDLLQGCRSLHGEGAGQ